jgi:hypothetical protein
MDQAERISRLASMLRQIAPEDTLESLPRPQAAASVLESTAEHEETADVALRKLEQGRHHEITPPEMFVLEAIVMPQNRPVVFIRDGVYEDVGAPWEHLNGAEVRSRITPLLASIGRTRRGCRTAAPASWSDRTC